MLELRILWCWVQSQRINAKSDERGSVSMETVIIVAALAAAAITAAAIIAAKVISKANSVPTG